MGTMQVVPPEYQTFWHGLTCVLVMTAGTIFLMWIGEQIDEYGIGNGISLLIMAGILARMPYALFSLLSKSTMSLTSQAGEHGLISLLVLAALFVAVILGVIAMTESQRRIPTQSARHVRGRRVYGGGSRQYLPLKVNQSGVMPIIFASSLLMFPYIILSGLSAATASWANAGGFWRFWQWIFREGASAFQSYGGYIYTLFYIILIYFFCYFWTAITFNPKDMADNLKDHGSFIPGYRPGRRTAQHLESVMLRITYVGAAFLAVVAIIPSLVQSEFNIDFVVANFLGGTGLLIVVSVCLDLIQKIDSHLIMRNYSGIMAKK
jgi:preprotein translocase subunit SecY